MWVSLVGKVSLVSFAFGFTFRYPMMLPCCAVLLHKSPLVSEKDSTTSKLSNF